MTKAAFRFGFLICQSRLHQRTKLVKVVWQGWPSSRGTREAPRAENFSEGIPHISRTSWQRMSTFSTPFNNDSRHLDTNWAGLFPSCIESWQVALLRWKKVCDKNDRRNRCLSFFLPLHTSSNLLSPLYRIHSSAKNSNISSNKHGYRCQFQFINVLSHS